jgi:hypothetical protein
MNLASEPVRVIETVDRRVLGAFRLVDAVTRLPVVSPARVVARSAVALAPTTNLQLDPQAVRILQGRHGDYVLWRAPFYDDYAAAFDPPPAPRGLRLAVSVVDAGAHYLPRLFEMELPRALSPTAENGVFEPLAVDLMRAPSAPVQDGWAVLRVRVTGTGPTAGPRRGALVRIFRSPRAAQDGPIGVGMTDWRGAIAGEALVAVSAIERFRPGGGANTVEARQAIELEVTDDPNFSGAGDELPNGTRLTAGTDAGLIRRRTDPTPPAPALAVLIRPDERTAQPPVPPIQIRAGREYVVTVTMP